MRLFAPAFVVVSALAILGHAPAVAQPEVSPTDGVTWTVNPAFGQAGEGRDNVSGVTCMALPPARTSCLVANDSTRSAQFFTISGTTIRPGNFVAITPAAPAGTLAFNPNMEGAANDGRFFYVVTSRGAGAATLLPDPSFLVARFPLDAGTPPLPPQPVPFASPATAGAIQISDRIRTALTAGIPIPDLAGQQLNRENAQIEGIAVRDRPRGDRVLHLGFRAPIISGKAFIASVPVESAFATSGALNPVVTALALGPTIGIRDLAAVSDGVLILAGPGRGVAERASLFHWNDTTGELKQVATIAEPANRNAEALLVLDEDPELFRFLLMFDGVPNGGPLEYTAPR